MTRYTTVADWQDIEAGDVVDVTIRQAGDEQYPMGWDDSLHLGTSATILFTATILLTNGRTATSVTGEALSRLSSSLGCSPATTGSTRDGGDVTRLVEVSGE